VGQRPLRSLEDDLSAEHRQADKELSSGRAPIEILKRYEKWKDIAMLSGPQGSRAIKGFRGEALSGDWKAAGRPSAWPMSCAIANAKLWSGRVRARRRRSVARPRREGQ
jgi:hypothetical protein